MVAGPSLVDVRRVRRVEPNPGIRNARFAFSMRRRAAPKRVFVVHGCSTCVVRGVHSSRQVSAEYVALLGGTCISSRKPHRKKWRNAVHFDRMSEYLSVRFCVAAVF